MSRRGRRRLARVADQRLRRTRRSTRVDRAEGQAGQRLREAPQVHERDSHLDQLADVVVDELVPLRVGTHLGLGLAVDPEPAVGEGVAGNAGIRLPDVGEPVLVGNPRRVGGQDGAAALRRNQDHRQAGGVPGRGGHGVRVHHDPGRGVRVHRHLQRVAARVHSQVGSVGAQPERDPDLKAGKPARILTVARGLLQSVPKVPPLYVQTRV